MKVKGSLWSVYPGMGGMIKITIVTEYDQDLWEALENLHPFNDATIKIKEITLGGNDDRNERGEKGKDLKSDT